MTLVRNDPWSLFSQMQKDLNRVFESRYGDAAADNSNVVTSHWAPAVDIKEEADRFVLYADLPGVDVKDIDITMEQGVLTIRGERKSETDVEKEGYRRVERVRGTFYRRFSLPDSADAERIAASSRGGVLEVVIPKQAKTQPRRISVAG